MQWQMLQIVVELKEKKGLITITIITETAVVKSGEIRQQEQQSGKKKIITIIT